MRSLPDYIHQMIYRVETYAQANFLQDDECVISMNLGFTFHGIDAAAIVRANDEGVSYDINDIPNDMNTKGLN